MEVSKMLKIGEFIQEFPEDCQVYMEGQNDFTVLQLDENDEPVRVLGTSKGREIKFVTRKDCKLKVIQPNLSHLSIDARAVKPEHEVVSDIPVELDVDLEPLGLEDKIKQFCAQLVQHEYGRDSAEVDQFEESFDYEIPDDDDEVILTGHEVLEMKPEEPIEQTTPQNPIPTVQAEAAAEAPQENPEANPPAT